MILAEMIIVMIVMLIMLVLTWIMPLIVEDVLVVGDAFEVRLELALALALWQRAELHIDVTTRHPRILIHMPHVQEIFLDLLGQQVTEFLMRHLAATELQLDAYLVPFREEVFGVCDLDQVIMRVDTDAEFHFLHLAALLVLVGLLLVLLLNILVLPVIDDLAYWRIGVRRYFHQVQSTLLGDANGLRRRNDAKLMMPILLDDTHLWRTDSLIDAGLINKTTVGAVPATWTITTAGTKCTTTTRALIASGGARRTCRPGCSQRSSSGAWGRRRPRR